MGNITGFNITYNPSGLGFPSTTGLPSTSKAVAMPSYTPLDPLALPTGAWAFRNSGILGYAGAGMSLLLDVGTMLLNMQINDVSGYEDYYKDFGSTPYYGDIDSIISQRLSSYLPEAPDWKEIRGMTTAGLITSGIGSSINGAMAGSVFGPWGAIIGGGLGALFSGIGSAVGNKKAKDAAEDLRLLRQEALLQNAYQYLVGLDNANRRNSYLAMLNLAAEGGPIHIKESKKGTFTAAAKKHGKGVLEFARLVLANKDNYSPAMVKKANFARNSAKWHSDGGALLTHGAEWNNGLTLFNNGGSHEENPYNGILLGIAPNGLPNLVEEGEVKYNDYIYSDRLEVPEDIRAKYKLPKKTTYAKAVKKLSKESEERPNDPISLNGLEAMLLDLMISLEEVRMKKNNKSKEFSLGGNLFEDGSLLRYAPILGNIAGTISSLAKSPDYSYADTLAQYARRAGAYQPITYKPSSNYMEYNPSDFSHTANLINALSKKAARDIMDAAGGNRGAAIQGLINNAYATLIALGNAYKADRESNLALRQKVEDFNRQTNISNSQGFINAAKINSGNLSKARLLELSGLEQALNMKQAIDKSREASINANLTNMFENLGNIGQDAYNRELVKMLADSEAFGALNDYAASLLRKNEGKLNKKKKGGFTY